LNNAFLILLPFLCFKMDKVELRLFTPSFEFKMRSLGR